ncbi:MAG: glycosyltransferase family 4 protein [Chloroflexota bacterium]|nr:glycosyltransferase family 4 protein [Chloroflexota bacterium]
MRGSAGNRVLMLLENCGYPRDTRVRREATALVDAGYRVSVICPADAGQPRHEILDGVAVYRYPAPPDGQGLLGYAREYGQSLAASFVLSLYVLFRRGFDVVHAHNPPDTFVFIAALYKLLGKRFVFDHHDLSPEMYYARFPGKGNRLVYRALVLLEKLSCRLADHVIATNQSYRAVETERGGVPPERITIVRNGPNPDRLRPVEPDPDLRANAPTIIGFGGTIGYQDGVEYLVRALARLVHDLGRTDVFCVVVGTGDALADVRALATRLGLDEYIRFTGWVSDADYLRYLSTADICVVPDPSNPFTDRSTMIKMSEYMALAKPVVAFDLPEHRFTAQDAALYAPPNDELELARAIARLMDDPERRRMMGELGRRRVEAQLAWSFSVPNLLMAYRAVLPRAAASLGHSGVRDAIR